MYKPKVIVHGVNTSKGSNPWLLPLPNKILETIEKIPPVVTKKEAILKKRKLEETETTIPDVTEEKKKRRLVRNREAAQASREVRANT
jgi:hypothetical protein